MISTWKTSAVDQSTGRGFTLTRKPRVCKRCGFKRPVTIVTDAETGSSSWAPYCDLCELEKEAVFYEREAKEVRKRMAVIIERRRKQSGKPS